MRIFLIGIGGIAMGNLAYMLKQLGHEVSGSDSDLYPPMSLKLIEWGLEVHKGFDPELLKNRDLVIVGNAISRGNPQVERMLEAKLEYMSMPEAIGHFFLKNKKVIVVAGTHGKTTTTFLIHYILSKAGLDPGLFVGGIRKDGHPGFALGKGEYFVIEGDEYDSAFFDKASKFLHYRPHYLALTSLDFDHADIFPDLKSIQTMFKRLINLTPGNGKIFYFEKSKSLSDLCKDFKYSKSEPYNINKKNSFFELTKKGLLHNKKPVRPNLIGEHNYWNMEVAGRISMEILGPGNENSIISAIEEFPGVKRRQEVLYSSNKHVLIEDFAHHPVAIEETIKAIKLAYPDKKIISLFEPRSATSHRNVFQKEFSASFKKSSAVMITELFNINKVSKDIRLNVKKLVNDTIKNSNVKTSVYCKKPQDIPAQLEKFLSANPKDSFAILAMSNGAFGGIYDGLIEILKKRES